MSLRSPSSAGSGSPRTRPRSATNPGLGTPTKQGSPTTPRSSLRLGATLFRDGLIAKDAARDSKGRVSLLSQINTAELSPTTPKRARSPSSVGVPDLITNALRAEQEAREECVRRVQQRERQLDEWLAARSTPRVRAILRGWWRSLPRLPESSRPEFSAGPVITRRCAVQFVTHLANAIAGESATITGVTQDWVLAQKLSDQEVGIEAADGTARRQSRRSSRKEQDEDAVLPTGRGACLQLAYRAVATLVGAGAGDDFLPELVEEWLTDPDTLRAASAGVRKHFGPPKEGLKLEPEALAAVRAAGAAVLLAVACCCQETQRPAPRPLRVSSPRAVVVNSPTSSGTESPLAALAPWSAAPQGRRASVRPAAAPQPAPPDSAAADSEIPSPGSSPARRRASFAPEVLQAEGVEEVQSPLRRRGRAQSAFAPGGGKQRRRRRSSEPSNGDGKRKVGAAEVSSPVTPEAPEQRRRTRSWPHTGGGAEAAPPPAPRSPRPILAAAAERTSMAALPGVTAVGGAAEESAEHPGGPDGELSPGHEAEGGGPLTAAAHLSEGGQQHSLSPGDGSTECFPFAPRPVQLFLSQLLPPVTAADPAGDLSPDPSLAPEGDAAPPCSPPALALHHGQAAAELSIELCRGFVRLTDEEAGGRMQLAEALERGIIAAACATALSALCEAVQRGKAIAAAVAPLRAQQGQRPAAPPPASSPAPSQRSPEGPLRAPAVPPGSVSAGMADALLSSAAGRHRRPLSATVRPPVGPAAVLTRRPASAAVSCPRVRLSVAAAVAMQLQRPVSDGGGGSPSGSGGLHARRIARDELAVLHAAIQRGLPQAGALPWPGSDLLGRSPRRRPHSVASGRSASTVRPQSAPPGRLGERTLPMRTLEVHLPAAGKCTASPLWGRSHSTAAASAEAEAPSRDAASVSGWDSYSPSVPAHAAQPPCCGMLPPPAGTAQQALPPPVTPPRPTQTRPSRLRQGPGAAASVRSAAAASERELSMLQEAAQFPHPRTPCRVHRLVLAAEPCAQPRRGLAPAPLRRSRAPGPGGTGKHPPTAPQRSLQTSSEEDTLIEGELRAARLAALDGGAAEALRALRLRVAARSARDRHFLFGLRRRKRPAPGGPAPDLAATL